MMSETETIVLDRDEGVAPGRRARAKESREPGGRTAARARGRDSRSLALYFREIGRIPLLTREQEVALGGRARAGDPKALAHLATANLRFVVSVAKRYAGLGLSLEDLVSEGNVGLIRAARRFDDRRGVRFLSYAVWWIKQAMLQALAEQVPVVRIPLNRTGLIHRMQRKADDLRKALEREPTYAEIASALSLTEEEVADTLESTRTYLSLDGGIDGNDDEVGLMEFLQDPSVAPPSERVELAGLRDDLAAAVATLPAREAEIVRLYYGLGKVRGQTLEEIGDRFRLSRERVRQIKEAAIRRLQHNAHAHQLKSYLE